MVPGEQLAGRLAVVLALLAAGTAHFAPPLAAQEAQPTPPPAAATGTAADYARDIKPLLRQRCYACHGALKQQAGLRLDTAALLLRGGDSGAVVQPRNPDASRLLQRVATSDLDERMPPEHEGEPLSPPEIALLRNWIAAGAPAPRDETPEADPRDHWAFRPLVRPSLPRVATAAWADHPIDAFVARELTAQQATPQPEADRLVLLRRLSIDLIGLPPTTEEIAALLRDPRPDWYERAVDRLLSDPRHGERWARHWMDIWRYSDWWGLGDQLRNSQKHLWHWRDWIVEALNADLPYDEMVRQMLAADELYPHDLARLRATGYLARNYFLFNRTQWMDETVEHVGKGFLGLTMNCAKCHDHKYDPISQVDYYRLRAFFEPYHVRMDVAPGVTDLAQDGIPRVFDGQLDAPTYRLIRGQESTPDKSQPLAPGVPAMLEFAPLAIEPVDLPPEAWQPERRPWVVAAHRAAARAKAESAAARLAAARQQTAAADDAERARLELAVAEQAMQVATAGQNSLELRAAALAARWQHADRAAAPDPAADAALRSAAQAAARAEREEAAAAARLALCEAELRLHQATAERRDAAAKQVAAAQSALEAALKKVEEPTEQFTPFVGAKWSATRFANSGSDDPAVGFPARSSGRRRALAAWITDRRHPLTARVAVNHVWNRHFGAPLAPTVFDLGRKNGPPRHRELLDWLAAELLDGGWSLKHLHRLIVTSATYRRASTLTGSEALLAADPDNLLLGRRTPLRLESQAVRDVILALAGTLDTTLGGPPVPPAQQADSTRRSLYFFHSNNDRNLFLTTFDEALVKDCYRRETSIVPQQALALTNSRLVLDAAPRIAEHLTRELPLFGAGNDDRAFVRLAFARLLAAEPTDAEMAASLQALEAWQKLPDAAREAPGYFARRQLVWVLLNHNDFVTLR